MGVEQRNPVLSIDEDELDDYLELLSELSKI